MRVEVVEDETRKKEILGRRQSYGFVGKSKDGKYLYSPTLNQTGMVPTENDIKVVYALDEGPFSAMAAAAWG